MYVYEEGKKEPTVKVSLDRYHIQGTKWSPAIAYDWNLERFLSYFRERPEYLAPDTKEELIELMGDLGPYGNTDIADKETINKVSEKLEPVSNKVFGISRSSSRSSGPGRMLKSWGSTSSSNSYAGSGAKCVRSSE